MRKRFRLIKKHGRIVIVQWVSDGKLFGPDWETVASFTADDFTEDLGETIVRLLNECDRHDTRRIKGD